MLRLFDQVVAEVMMNPTANHDEFFRTTIKPRIERLAQDGETLDRGMVACLGACRCYDRWREIETQGRAAGRKSGWAWHVFVAEFGAKPNFRTPRGKFSDMRLRKAVGLV